MFRNLPLGDERHVNVFVDGISTTVTVGETAATVLMRQTEAYSRTTPVSGVKRAPYCMMGVCFDCLALIDGMLVQTCLTPVREGMRIDRQQGRRSASQ